MKTYVGSIAPSAFILSDDGIYVGTILATTHGLGKSVYVSKMVHRNDDITLENTILPYKVEINGDVRIYVSEPTLIRYTIVQDI